MTSASVQAFSSSTWSDALDRLSIDGVVRGLRLIHGSRPIVGRAVTARQEVVAFDTVPASAFDIAGILEATSSGDVLVVDVGGAPVSSFGGLAARTAVRRGVAGVLVDGGCRDVDEVEAAGISVWARHVTPASGKRRLRTVEINGPVVCGGIEVRAGDVVVADQTGIVVVPASRWEEAAKIAADLDARDRELARGIEAGGDFRSIARALDHA
jgi:regulator of RNase E activity RraA